MFLALLVCAPLALAAQPRDEATSRADREPISAVPAPPVEAPDRIALGEALFHDSRLSQSGSRSCGNCHDTTTNGATARAHDLTPDGAPLPFNTPTIFNAALSYRLNWEGNFRALERLTENALRSPLLMAASPETVAARVAADAALSRRFRETFGRDPDFAGVVEAIVAYERSLLTPGARFDRWLLGEDDAITQRELAGYRLFTSLGCVSCHQGVNVGGNLMQKHGVFHPLGAQTPELLRVPSLRNVAVTPPYFHDGSAATLREAIAVMAYVQLDRKLNDAEIDEIAAFLDTLTGLYRGRPLTPAPLPP